MKIKNKKISIIIAMGIVLVSIGTVGALNGWFGGGSKIPSDTFTRGLVGYWSFDEGNGTTTYDATENNNDGQFMTTASSPKWITGKVGSALEFDGKNDYVDLPSNDSLYPTQFTIMALVNLDSFGTDENIGTVIFSNYEGLYNFIFYISNAGIVSIRVHNGVTNFTQTSSSAIATGSWYFVGATFDGTNLNVYINGVNKGSRTATNVAQTNIYAAIGQAVAGGGGFFKGSIDEVRLYNRALSAAEIRYHYNRGGPVAHWTFDEGNGTTTYDSTDNGDDGQFLTASSSPTWTTGKYGTALSFDGVDDFVQIPNSSDLDFGDKDFSIGFWIFPNNISVNMPIIGKRQDALPGEEFSWYIAAQTGYLYLYLSSNGSSWNILNGQVSTYSANEWSYFTIKRSDNYLYVFKNGQKVYEKTDLGSSSLATIDSIAKIGGLEAWNIYFDGLIDDVRIYNYARTADEIALDYNAGFAARFGPQSSCDEDPGSCMDYGLVGYWNFEEGEGTYAYDSSDYDNDGTLGGYAGATSSDPKWITGAKPLSGGASGGGALEFDGKDDYVPFSNSDSLKPTIFTIEAWIKTLSSSGSHRIFSNYDRTSDSTNDEHGFLFGLRQVTGSDYTIVCQIDDHNGLPASGLTGFTTVNDGNWHHVIVTHNGTTNTYYIDGKAQPNTATVNNAVTYHSTSYPAIGVNYQTYTYDDYIGFWDGSIDEVRMYNRALSAEEVRYHYNRGEPVAYWKFDEGSGTTTYDSSNNGNDGQFLTADSSPTWVTGKYGTALSFDGVDDYVSVADSSSTSITTAITISAWVKANTLSSSGDGVVYKPNVWGLDVKSDGAIRSAFYTSSNGVLTAYDSDAGEVEIDLWYYLAVTYDGTEIKIYKNGIQIKKFDLSGTIQTSTNALKIGEEYSSTYNFDGFIDDVRIYDYARTYSQIQQDYNQGMAAHFGPEGQGVPEKDCINDPAACIDYGLVGYWNFEEGGGTTTYDGSDYSNDGQFASSASTPRWTRGIKPLSGGVSGGGALEFDGNDDYVNAGDGESLRMGTNDYSVEAWVKSIDTKYQFIAGIMHANLSTYELHLREGNIIKWRTDDSGETPTSYEVTASFNYADGNWHHIIGTRVGSIGKIYVDGVFIDSGTLHATDVTANTDYNFYIGKRSDGGWMFNGSIDEVRVYNRDLSAEEVRYHYNQGKPIAYWKFDEGYGTTTYDESANDNDGTFLTADSSPSWVQGKYGSALSFDGVDDYVNCGSDSSLDLTEAITISVWIYPRGGGEQGYGRIISKGGDTDGYEIYIRDSSYLLTFRNDDGIGNSVESSIAVNLNAWNHIAVTYDREKVIFYINGNFAGESARTEALSVSSFDLLIGEGPETSNRTFDGLIDDVKIYSYARTYEQIIQDYNLGLSTHFQ